jgi:putative membrane protein
MSARGPVQPNELRDHLANERTLLAWIRTSITIGALGFVVAKFGEVNGGRVHPLTARAGAVIGVTLVIAGMVTGILATFRFLQTGKDIESGVVRFSPALDIALAVVFSITGAVLVVYLIATS